MANEISTKIAASFRASPIAPYCHREISTNASPNALKLVDLSAETESNE